MDDSMNRDSSWCYVCHGEDSTTLPVDDCMQMQSIREHLVQEHSRIVARAFLHPSLSDSIHMWISSCVLYSPILPEENNLTEALAAFLQQAQNVETEEKRKGKKRPIVDTDEQHKKCKNVVEDDLTLEVNGWDLTGPTPSSYFTNADQLAIATGLNDKQDDIATPPSSTALTADDRICHMCWEESRYPGRHIAQKHLKNPLYECPVCHGFGSYEGCTVQKHINKVHPDSDALPVSNLEKYADEIRELQTACFPNRPMKLVRNHQSTRPRERHHCKLCSVQVAQSDRQRHVYHKHLRRERVFECPLCSFHSNYDVHRVKWHIKWMHKEEGTGMEPMSHENEYREEIDALNEECFPGWQHRRKPFWWLEGEEPSRSIVKEEIEEKIMNGERKTSSPSISNSSSNSPQEKESSNEWTCQLCGKEFKPSSNFLRHVAKEHMSIPLYQCPICQGQGGQDAYEIRAHMQKVHSITDRQPISNIEKHAHEIQTIYAQCFPGRKLKCLQQMNIQSKEEKKIEETKEEEYKREDDKVTCQECLQQMKTEDRQIHVYRHHLRENRLYECPLCDFSHHACSSDVRSHIKYTHRDNPNVIPRANLIEHSEKIAEWNERCFPGWINRRLPCAALEDFNRCRLCDEEVRQTSRHIAEVHLNIPLHQCPLCEYGAAESRLVKRHMRNNHKKKELKTLEPIANVVARRGDFSTIHDRCFPGRPKRLSNITISDEGRRAKCRLCGGTFSRKKRRGHLLQVHIAKTAFKCSECSFSSTHEESHVAVHVRDVHDGDAATISRLPQLKEQLSSMAKQCFPDWKPTVDELIRTR